MATETNHIENPHGMNYLVILLFNCIGFICFKLNLLLEIVFTPEMVTEGMDLMFKALSIVSVSLAIKLTWTTIQEKKQNKKIR